MPGFGELFFGADHGLPGSGQAAELSFFHF